MSPTPVTFHHPAAPTAYAWEATNEEIAARYGVPVERIARFDLNTAATPPALLGPILARGRFVLSVSEYPPADYRELTAAAAARYAVRPEEILVGAGADEVLDVIAKTYLPAGGAAVVPTPTYAMFRVLTEQRDARAVAVPRVAAEGFRLDPAAIRDAAREAHVVWLCSPNNPTALAEPEGLVEGLLEGPLADASAAGRPAPVVVLDEAYAEFAGRTLLDLRTAYPRLIVIRTVSKAYSLAGLRVGFGISSPEVVAEMSPYRPPGSVAVISVTVATEALRDPRLVVESVARVTAERERLAAGLAAAGWAVKPSITNFLPVDFGSPERAAAIAEGLLRRGLVPRTFGAGHPLADHLRLTVRDIDQDDRLIAAARELTARGPG